MTNEKAPDWNDLARTHGPAELQSAFDKAPRNTLDANSGQSTDGRQLVAMNATPTRSKQTDMLLALGTDIELFHAPDGTGYADIEINGHRETWPLNGKGFKNWLMRKCYELTGSVPNPDAVQTAINLFEARAQFDAPERSVFVRTGGHSGRIYLDLGDEHWRAVEIGTDGWRVIDRPPIRFRRPANMRPLPVPEKGGSIDVVRRLMNVRNEEFVLVVTWLMAALRDCGPYPLLVVSGEQGSAKSGLVKLAKMIIDPAKAPLRSLPHSDRDLFIAANNNHVLAFDNVSSLPNWMSDTLCRLATGGGYAVRQLYTDGEEAVFDAACPMMLNGIEDMVTRPDLADRAILLTLKTIPEHMRRVEKDVSEEFEREKASILGALLTGVAEGLRNLPSVRLEKSPRMADFAVWGSACETAFWPSGTFMNAYRNNLATAVDNVIDADPIASAVRSLMLNKTKWTGTATRLLDDLNLIASVERFNKDWPKNGQALSGRLRRGMTFLRKVGINIEFGRDTGHARDRLITLSLADQAVAESASAVSGASAVRAHDNDNVESEGEGESDAA
jgi:hypothetical protein